MDEMLPRLIDEFGYPKKGAQIVVQKLMQCTPEVKEAFLAWWHSGETGALEVEGFTVKRLMKHHGMNPVAAFLTLDWLKREPDAALSSLVKGHDYVK